MRELYKCRRCKKFYPEDKMNYINGVREEDYKRIGCFKTILLLFFYDISYRYRRCDKCVKEINEGKWKK